MYIQNVKNYVIKLESRIAVNKHWAKNGGCVGQVKDDQ